MKTPTIKKKYDFLNALEYAQTGKKIQREGWGEIYGLFHEGRLRLLKEDGKYYDWIVTEADFADDWIII